MSSGEPWHRISACSAFFLYRVPLVAGNANTVLVITGLNVWAKQVRFNDKSWHELLDVIFCDSSNFGALPRTWG